MRKIYTLLIALFLTIISFGQTWEEIEVPDSTIHNAFCDRDGNLFIINQEKLFINSADSTNWHSIKIYNNAPQFFNKGDSILLFFQSQQSDYIVYINMNSYSLDTMYKNTPHFYYNKILLTKKGSILIGCRATSNYPHDIGLLRITNYKQQDTVMIIPYPTGALEAYYENIIQSKVGKIYAGITTFDGGDGGIYESDDDGITWSKIYDKSFSTMWINTNDNLSWASDYIYEYKNNELVLLESDFYDKIDVAYDPKLITDTNNIVYSSSIDILKTESEKNWVNMNFNLEGNFYYSKLIIGQNGYLYLITRDWNLIDNKVKYVNHLYRLSEPIYKSSNTTTAINENTHTDNILNGTFRLYSVTGTYFGTAEIQNSDLSELKERVKKGVYILQNIATKQISKVVLQ